jgi:3-oxoadipate enol-lactonase/4-carboxymuconolactone decarboxylase
MSAELTLSAVRIGDRLTSARSVLVLGPSLGTSARALWGRAGAVLAEYFDVVAWDLPGHGVSAPSVSAFSMSELAAAVLASVDRVLAEHDDSGGAFHYAGDSVGGAVGLELLLAQPRRISTATLLCTGAKIGDAVLWTQRATLVREHGTEAVVEGSSARWFAPGFAERQPAVSRELLQALRRVDPDSYAHVCEALACFDVRDRLADIRTPVLAVAGALDQPTPVGSLDEIATGVAHGRTVVLDDVAHLAPAEAPAQVADLITAHACTPRPPRAGNPALRPDPNPHH